MTTVIKKVFTFLISSLVIMGCGNRFAKEQIIETGLNLARPLPPLRRGLLRVPHGCHHPRCCDGTEGDGGHLPGSSSRQVGEEAVTTLIFRKFYLTLRDFSQPC